MSETVYEPDFIERNGAWLLSLVGILVTCFSGLLAYFLKSRCETIKCCGMECQRAVLDLERVPESALQTALQVELDRRASETVPARSVLGSLVSQALRQPRTTRPRPRVEVTSTSSESK